MANKAISELPQAQNVNNQDLFVLEQSGIAKKLTAETFITEQGIIDALAEALDGHGGISSVTLQSLSGRIRTYRITFTDGSATTFQVLDGTTIERIAKTSEAGLVSTYTIFMSDGTTSFFQVRNGQDGSATWDQINSKAPIISETTASSAIATFADGADDIPMQNVVAEIDPVQDLNGYNAPWPSGGGKNLLNVAVASTTGSATTAGFVTIGADGSITLNGTISTVGYVNIAVTVTAGNYVLSANNSATNTGVEFSLRNADISFNSGWFSLDATNRTNAFTVPSTASYFRIQINAGTYSNFKFYPQLESGSTATAYAPYSNICPITGWTGANVYRMGKNLFDVSTVNVKKYIDTSGNLATSNNWSASDYIPVKAGQTYTLSGVTNTGWAATHSFYDEDKTFISYVYALNHATFTVPNGAYYVRLSLKNETPTDAQLEVGSTATDFEAYAGTTKTVSWQTEAGTVYGGTIDAATGLLTVEYVRQTITSFAGVFGAVTNGYCAYVVLDLTTHIAENIDSTFMKSNVFTYTSASRNNAALYTYGGDSGETRTHCFILPSSVTSLEEANAWLANNPTECTFKLATNQTYQLSKQDLNTLFGNNTVWSDLGDVTVTYPADTKLYIEKLTQPTEDDLVANQAITSGQYFMIGNSLYLALANIASGAAITIGTNAQRVSLADALNTINS